MAAIRYDEYQYSDDTSDDDVLDNWKSTPTGFGKSSAATFVPPHKSQPSFQLTKYVPTAGGPYDYSSESESEDDIKSSSQNKFDVSSQNKKSLPRRAPPPPPPQPKVKQNSTYDASKNVQSLSLVPPENSSKFKSTVEPERVTPPPSSIRRKPAALPTRRKPPTSSFYKRKSSTPLAESYHSKYPEDKPQNVHYAFAAQNNVQYKSTAAIKAKDWNHLSDILRTFDKSAAVTIVMIAMNNYHYRNNVITKASGAQSILSLFDCDFLDKPHPLPELLKRYSIRKYLIKKDDASEYDWNDAYALRKFAGYLNSIGTVYVSGEYYKLWFIETSPRYGSALKFINSVVLMQIVKILNTTMRYYSKIKSLSGCCYGLMNDAKFTITRMYNVYMYNYIYFYRYYR